MMLITESNFLSGNSFSHLLPVNRNGRKITKILKILRIATNIQAQKRGLDEDSRVNKKTHFSFRFPNTILVTQSAIGVLGLRFIDAGYSGDWSRIGVITKEAEDLLKLAAFVVVPCCIYPRKMRLEIIHLS